MSKKIKQSGSLGSVWKITYPLMISMLSTALLTTSDRFMLSLYSIESMNASVTSGMFFFGCLLWLLTIGGTSEVFVGQFNGSGQFHFMPKATWQMIWLSLMSIVFYLPVSIWAPDFVFAGSLTKDLETIYFRWLIGPAFIQGIYAALSGYFIGQKRVLIVTIITVIGNLFNILFNYILIFGWDFIPAMGIKGAAIGTDLSVLLQAITMFSLFIYDQLKNSYPIRKNMRLDRSFIKRYLKVGAPTAIAHTIEMLAHFFIFKIMALSGFIYITTLSIVQSIYFFIGFTTEALNKGVATISANAIGSKDYDALNRTLASAFKLLIIIASIGVTGIIFKGDWIIGSFLQSEQGKNLDAVLYKDLVQNCFYSLIFLCIFFVFDGFAWSISGALSACGKTKNIMVAQMVCVWAINAIPGAILIYYFRVNPMWIFAVSCIYAFCVALWLIKVYQKIEWKDVHIV